jgi:hypothetical protein
VQEAKVLRRLSWKRVIPAIAVTAVLTVVAAFLLVNRSGPSLPGQTAGKHHDANEAVHRMSEALAKHPSLASHRLPLAFVSEKLESNGGEASREIVNGPAQESYDQRAYPRKYVTHARQVAAADAFSKARARATSATGRDLLKKAQGTQKVQSWTPIGPDGGVQVAETTYTGTSAVVSGRATSLATGTSCSVSRCVLYAGTAGGGLWKTTNALAANPQWVPIGADIPSTAIGVVYRAPGGRLFVGTGEPNGSGDSEAGVGLYTSTDGGKTFHHVPTAAGGSDFALNRSIAAIAVDPQNSQHIYVGTAVARHGSSSVNGGRFTPPGSAKVGLYETTNGGTTWHLSLSEDSDVVDPSTPNGSDFFRGGISKIAYDRLHADTVFASMFDYGLFRRVGSGDWQQVYKIHQPGSEDTSLSNRVEFALTRVPGTTKTRIFLGDATYFQDSVSGLLRSDNGNAHHPTWTSLSSPKNGTPGYGSYNFCQGQCSYDMVVATPPGRPNEVFLSGAMNYPELQAFGGPGNSNGRAVVRSTDAGVHFTDMTNDAQPSPNGLHPDHHALVFAPTSSGPETFFTASDGGLVRQRGPYVDKTSDCTARRLSGALLQDCQQFLSAIPTKNTTLNRGLQTLQYQSASVTNGGSVVQAGTQDNGTWESDASLGFVETVGGDGGQSGFNPTNSQIRYHSYFGPNHDVSFDGGSPTGWDSISDPLSASGEAASFYVPLTADPHVSGTVFDGLQHVWRTTDNGGDRAFLDRYCNELTGDYSHRPHPCGDWQPLGGSAGDLSGGNAANYVVAIERAPSNNSTLWAATRLGGLYVSSNANASDPSAVTYQRLDQTLGLPHRFVSGIAIDPSNPNHAFVSYSGYSAYSPGGHVYEVTWDPTTSTGTADDLSANLGDQPVTDIVYVPSTKALFVATDFGVLSQSNGSSNWIATTGLPKVAVYGLTLAPSGDQLFAATHGRSIWKLHLA